MRAQSKRGLRRCALCAVVVGLQLLLLVSAVQADGPPPPPSGWSVVAASGSVDASNGSYRLHSTAGQPSPVGLTDNGEYVLGYGYWAPSGGRLTVYLPLLLRSST